MHFNVTHINRLMSVLIRVRIANHTCLDRVLLGAQHRTFLLGRTRRLLLRLLSSARFHLRSECGLILLTLGRLRFLLGCDTQGDGGRTVRGRWRGCENLAGDLSQLDRPRHRQRHAIRIRGVDIGDVVIA